MLCLAMRSLVLPALQILASGREKKPRESGDKVREAEAFTTVLQRGGKGEGGRKEGRAEVTTKRLGIGLRKKDGALLLLLLLLLDPPYLTSP